MMDKLNTKHFFFVMIEDDDLLENAILDKVRANIKTKVSW